MAFFEGDRKIANNTEELRKYTEESRKCYNSGWQDGFVYALDTVLEAINRNYNEADREGDDEYINERMAGWNDVENIIKETKESYLGNKE